jgi:hypothetical protein
MPKIEVKDTLFTAAFVAWWSISANLVVIGHRTNRN